MQYLLEKRDFFRCKATPFSAFQVPQGQRPLPDAAQTGAVHSGSIAHSADLAVAALVDGNQEPGLSALGGNGGHGHGRHGGLCCLAPHGVAQLNVVLFLYK